MVAMTLEIVSGNLRKSCRVVSVLYEKKAAFWLETNKAVSFFFNALIKWDAVEPTTSADHSSTTTWPLDLTVDT